MAIAILKDSDSESIVVKAGTSQKITGLLKDYDDVAIVKASLLTITLTLRDGLGNFIKRGATDINALDIKDLNGGYVATDGTLSLYLSATDNTLLNPGNDTEKRIVLIEYTWNDGVDAANQNGAGEYQYTVDSTTDAK